MPAFLALAIMILWAAHDGGYDQDTWYWGALAVLGLLAALVISGLSTPLHQLDRRLKVALAAFALYVAWSYLSITWASSKGDALTGSNRALLYLLVLTLFSLTRWNTRRALAALLAYGLALTVIAAMVLIGMTSGGHASSLFSVGRLVSPTGYFNSAAGLFMTSALVTTSLAIRRDLPAILRGVLLGGACASLQLVLLAESRGWLFTLPLVLLAALLVSRDRIRLAIASLLPTVGALASLHWLLQVFRAAEGAHATRQALIQAADHAGKVSLAISAVVVVVGAVSAALDARVRPRPLSVVARRTVGTAMAGCAVAIAIGGALAATHGHPIRFASDQWRGFTGQRASSDSTSSHFATVGTERYDAWRVSIHAFSAHPIGGLGQDNFADYYVRHRRTSREYQWTHSWEMRLLAHTGLVGAALLLTFLAGGLAAAVTARRRRGPSAGQLVGVAMLPVIVWLVHGSIDWFWETPALSGPALGFLALGGALAESSSNIATAPARWPRMMRNLAWGAGVVAVGAALVVLGFSYLSVREVSTASDLRATAPAAAIRDLHTAAELNPLTSEPARIAGTIALQNGDFQRAGRLFEQTISREPGGWFGWFGAGLASSALGNETQARHYLRVAASINNRQPAVKQALGRVNTTHPLTPSEALRLLILVQ